jgi:uncharacterized protein YecT (DUF1311 family)
MSPNARLPSRCSTMRARRALAALVLLVGVLLAGTLLAWQQAAAAPVSAHDQCLTRAHGVTVGIRACDSVELKRQDVRLNTAYQALSKLLSAADRAQLVAAQRSWLTFRKLDCDFRASREAGGSLAPVIADNCVIELTDARAATLEDLLKNE